MNSIITNYCVYEGWKPLGLEPIPNVSGPFTATHYYSAQQLSLVTHGTRLDWDGTTPLPEQGTVSFHIRDDMFQTWLDNHQINIGCTFNKTTSAPGKRGKKYEELSEEEMFRRERLEELSQQLRTILMRGTSILEASSLLGENARRCREMSRAREKMMLSRGDFLTRRDVIGVLGYIAGVGADEVLDMVEEWDVEEEEEEEEEDLTADRRQRGMDPPQRVAPELMAAFLREEVGAFLGEVMVEEIGEEPAITVTRATPRVQEPTRSSTTADSVDLLRRNNNYNNSSDNHQVTAADILQRRRDVALNALRDLERLTATAERLGLDPELEKNDIRLRREEPNLTTANGSSLLARTSEYTHPNPEIFTDEESRLMAQSNFDIIMDSLTTSYCAYEAWKEFNASLPSSSLKTPRIDIVTLGTLQKDGTTSTPTPTAEPGVLSFLIYNDMLQTWLEDHSTLIGCLYSRRSPVPKLIKCTDKMATVLGAKNSWEYRCECYRFKVAKRGGWLQGNRSHPPENWSSCKAKIMAYSGISRFPAAADGGGGSGGQGVGGRKRKEDLTLIVYYFEHNHDLRLRDIDKETDKDKELRLERGRKELLIRYIQQLLFRGLGIQDVLRLLGNNEKRVRELRRVGEAGKGGSGLKYKRSDFLTRGDIIGALESMLGMDRDTPCSSRRMSRDKRHEQRQKHVELKTIGEDVSKQQGQLENFQRALAELEGIKEPKGLDVELDEGDLRMREALSPACAHSAHMFIHPQLQAHDFMDSQSKQTAQSNYSLILESITSNYFVYEAWTLLGLNLTHSRQSPNSSSSSSASSACSTKPNRVTLITRGTRLKFDGTTPTPTPNPHPDHISFHVLSDMFPAWLEDHQNATGCKFVHVRTVTHSSPSSPSSSSSSKQFTGQSGGGGDGWIEDDDGGCGSKLCSIFVCSQHRISNLSRSGEEKWRKEQQVGCEAQIKAFLGISKPTSGAGGTKTIDVALVVYRFEHNHPLLLPLISHLQPPPSPPPTVNEQQYQQQQQGQEQDQHQRQRQRHILIDRWTNQVKALLVRGNNIQDVVFLFGGEDVLSMLRRLASGVEEREAVDGNAERREEEEEEEGSETRSMEGKVERQEVEEGEEGEFFFTLDDISVIHPLRIPRLDTTAPAAIVANATHIQILDDEVLEEELEEGVQEEVVLEEEEGEELIHEDIMEEGLANVFRDQTHEQDRNPDQDQDRQSENCDHYDEDDDEEDMTTATMASLSIRENPLNLLKRYLDEWDNSLFAPCMEQVDELVDHLRVMKPPSDLPPVIGVSSGAAGGGKGGGGVQAVKRRRLQGIKVVQGMCGGYPLQPISVESSRQHFFARLQQVADVPPLTIVPALSSGCETFTVTAGSQAFGTDTTAGRSI
ncbi:hypothetical protein BGX24_009626 [Mortierella sp. AD032]|nr:hypothetical protein BGX24_009626 [Mortierella sp. AD032]